MLHFHYYLVLVSIFSLVMPGKRELIFGGVLPGECFYYFYFHNFTHYFIMAIFFCFMQ